MSHIYSESGSAQELYRSQITEKEFHPIANVFPRLTHSELMELAASIKDIGLLYPLILFEDKILEDRERYTACQQIGVQPQYECLKAGLGNLVLKRAKGQGKAALVE
jgi:hypothetical protein